ncbi:MAG: hypothetical protein AAF086_05625 [Planctomycetota bacterium]
MMLALLAVMPAAAQDSLVWEFDDDRGVRLDEAASATMPHVLWNERFENSAMTGDGAFVLRRGTGSTTNSFAPISESSGKMTVTYVLRGWSFKGSKANETLRLGLVHKTDDAKPHVLCQFKFGRKAEDLVTLSAEAFGDGAETVDSTISFEASSDDALTLVLVYEPSTNIYEGWAKHGDGENVSLGQAKTSSERQANFLRIGATGSFMMRDDSEYVEIDRVELAYSE